MSDTTEPSSLTIQVSPLSLSTLDNGTIAKQFERELQKIAECFQHDVDEFSGKVKASVILKVELEYNPDTGNTALLASVASKLPKLRATVKPLLLRGGKFLLEEDDGLQLQLYSKGEGGDS